MRDGGQYNNVAQRHQKVWIPHEGGTVNRALLFRDEQAGGCRALMRPDSLKVARIAASQTTKAPERQLATYIRSVYIWRPARLYRIVDTNRLEEGL